jgi:hypothetical protein
VIGSLLPEEEILETQSGSRFILRLMSGEKLAMKFFSGLKLNDDCCCLRLMQGSDLLFSNTAKRGSDEFKSLRSEYATKMLRRKEVHARIHSN